ncbi:P-loop containing nucleoside triphosphate hydrolase protein [Epithele typhae]|uniref:P-loop containing nucleoside triphosphate hydrolase protein n=1 Tax=Epithele typhae TaxID=378194 RepID=UPI002007531F|nr:P-loop containing nucleoside triphosphate hydrolase protein [Epithele typhae]KAH9913984.1 P-loop containing nucleoside triphosphate hydrolase protein [Epithele typhae]
MHVDEPIRWPSGEKGKGKAKAISNDEPQDLDNLPWVEKYRPVTLDDVVSHQDITSTIEKFIEKDRVPHMLFYGPPGTGKTSTILAVARRIYGPSFRRQILELNASDDRGIDAVRVQIKNFAETHMMTTAAQSALRRVIEQYTRNVRFCIICNYVNKIIPHVKLTPEGKQALLKLSKGDMRRALNVLQACHAAYDLTGEEEIYNYIEAIVNSMLQDEFTTSYNSIDHAIKTDRGLALPDLINGAYEYIETIEFKPHVRIYYWILSNYRVANALLGAFKHAVELSAKAT